MSNPWTRHAAPPRVIENARRRGQAVICVRVGTRRVVREPGETVGRMVQRAAAMHGTDLPFYLVYEAEA